MTGGLGCFPSLWWSSLPFCVLLSHPAKDDIFQLLKIHLTSLSISLETEQIALLGTEQKNLLRWQHTFTCKGYLYIGAFAHTLYKTVKCKLNTRLYHYQYIFQTSSLNVSSEVGVAKWHSSSSDPKSLFVCLNRKVGSPDSSLLPCEQVPLPRGWEEKFVGATSKLLSDQLKLLITVQKIIGSGRFLCEGSP